MAQLLSKKKLLAMVARLNWLWRLICTAIAFALWGIIGFLLFFILLPFRKNTRHQFKIRRFIGMLWSCFVKFLSITGVLKLEINGIERLGKKGQLLISNHPSLLDVVLLLAHIPEVNCVVKADLLKNPSMRNQILSCNYIINHESEHLLEDCEKALQNECLLLFPEGTRTRRGQQVKLHRGAISIGLRSAKIITPIKITMHPESLKKGEPWYRIAKHKMHYKIDVGADIFPEELLKHQSIPMASRRLHQNLEQYYFDPKKEKTCNNSNKNSKP